MATRTLDLTFTGAVGGRFPTTWSQREFWWTINHHKPSGYYQPTGIVHLSEPRPVATVLDVLRRLVVRHQALRATVAENDDGELWQLVADSGHLPVRLEEISDETEIDRTFDRVRNGYLAEEPDLRRSLPLKLVLMTAGDQVHAVVFTCSHIVLDGGSVNVLKHEINRLLAGETLPPVVYEPADRARDEATERGLRMSQKSLDHWRSVLASSPPGLFAEVEAGRAPLWLGWLRSGALRVADHKLVHEHGLSSSAVFLSAASCVLGLVTGNSGMTFRVPAGNRLSPAQRNFVGALSQHAVLNVELTPGTFHELVRLVERRMMAAYSRTQYDPVLMRQIVQQVGADRGVPVDLTYLFNELRVESQKPNRANRTQPTGSPDVSASTVAWDLLHTSNSDIKVYVRVRDSDTGHDPVLDLAADENCLTRPQIESALLAIERLVVSAAERDFPLSDTAHVAA